MVEMTELLLLCESHKCLILQATVFKANLASKSFRLQGEI